MKLHYIYVYLLLAGNNLLSQTHFNDDVLAYLNSFDLDKVKSITSNKKFNTTEIKHLSQIFYNWGESKFTDSLLLNNKLRLLKNPYQNTIKAIYYSLYKSKSPNLISILEKGLSEGKEKNNTELQKLNLWLILEYFSKGGIVSKKQFLYYLDSYTKLAHTVSDKANILLFKYLWQVRTSNRDEEYSTTLAQNNYSYYLKYKDSLSDFINNKFLMNIGTHFRVKKANDSAIKFYKEILKYPNKPYLMEFKFISSLDIGAILVDQNKIKEANLYFENSKKFISKPKRKYQLLDYYNFKSYYYYAKIKKFDSAYVYSEKASELYRSLKYSENAKLNTELQVQLKTAEKEKQYLKEKRIKERNRNIALALAGGLVATGIIGFLVYKNIKKKKRLANKETQLKTRELAAVLKEQELVFIDAMIEGQEKERQRIAEDLHDDLGGLMASLKLHFESLQQKPTTEKFSKTQQFIDDAYHKIRTIAHAKNAGVIAKQGLLKAVQQMAAKISASNQLQIEVIDHGLEEPLENSLELSTFRTIQELVTNIIKHANASEISIHLTLDNEFLNLMVEDNGIGFDAQNIAPDKGMGLSNIQKRVAHLNGNIQIDSGPYRGTTIIIDFPLSIN